jgi:hypothetical protein
VLSESIIIQLLLSNWFTGLKSIFYLIHLFLVIIGLMLWVSLRPKVIIISSFFLLHFNHDNNCTQLVIQLLSSRFWKISLWNSFNKISRRKLNLFCIFYRNLHGSWCTTILFLPTQMPNLTKIHSYSYQNVPDGQFWKLI